MNLKIGARTYSIEKWSATQIESFTGRDSNEVCGFTDYYKSKIIINGDASKDVREETLLHEIMHTLLDNSGIEEIGKQLKEEPHIGELVATIIAPRLHAMLKDNDIQSVLSSI
jgi:Zn-dependent peptidase ImmA (M78 family)